MTTRAGGRAFGVALPAADGSEEMDMPRWRVAVGSLAPLVATAIVALLHGRGIPSTLLLLVAVAFAYLYAGLTAGVAALVLAAFLYDLVTLPIRGTIPSASWEAAGFVTALVLTGAAMIGVLSRLRAAASRADEAREVAERRARDLADRIELIGPMLDAAPIGFALVDGDLRVQYVNEKLAEIDTVPVAEHLGRRCGDVFGLELAAIVDAPLRAALETGQAQPDASGVDGTDRDLVASCYPVRVGRDVIGVAVMLVDITERRRLGQLELETANLRAVAELAFKLEQAQRLAGFASWEFELATARYTFSAQLGAILGIEGTQFETMAAVGAYVHPEDLEKVRAARDALRTDHTPFTLEYRLVRPDGAVLDVLSSGEVFRDEEGRPVRLWGTIQDVTEQRAAERATRDAVRRAEQARADLEVEHQALQMFQRAMLPAELPRLATVDLSAVYLPMAERVDIGGDWYDAFVLPDGRLALAVGDVTGHDLRAATVMGQVRNAVRAYACEDPAPGTVLARANTLLARLPDLDLVTMLFGVYDPNSHELTWSNAGHPPPLLRRGDAVTTLTQDGGLLLGVIPDGEPYPEHRLRLAPGDSVLWYTDGIVDHRSIDPVDAMERLSRAFAAARGPAGDLLGRVSADVLADQTREDDVCLLALRRAGDPVAAAARPARGSAPGVGDDQPAYVGGVGTGAGGATRHAARQASAAVRGGGRPEILLDR
ncbi:MAG: phosphoserine phosphatase RsbU/P [Micromonosporaceae bacterium]|nr:phosphoserine phosphatase RsbU/P [Micromonosporaceae bacterium]MDT5037552.1 phosphoserine phosphatase RsbU/P [Micromonosporaceae bacterium]